MNNEDSETTSTLIPAVSVIIKQDRNQVLKNVYWTVFNVIISQQQKTVLRNMKEFVKCATNVIIKQHERVIWNNMLCLSISDHEAWIGLLLMQSMLL